MGPDEGYISRGKLKEELGEKAFNNDNYTDEFGHVIQIIDGMPAAEVAPVKCGKWLNSHHTLYVKCSLCGGTVPTNWRGFFCQNCGAIMADKGKVFYDG